MSQQMRRTFVAVGLAAALLLAVPAPSRAAAFQGSAFATGLVERLWIWVWSQVRTVPVKDATPVPVTNGNGNGNGNGSTPPPSGTTESGSMIDPDGRP